MKKLCPICLLLYSPAGFAMHVKQHVRRGELVRREVVRSESGDVTRYQWARPAAYSKPGAK